MTPNNRMHAQRNWDICTSSNDLDGAYFAIKKSITGATLSVLKDLHGNDLTDMLDFFNDHVANGDVLEGSFSQIEVSSGTLAAAID